MTEFQLTRNIEWKKNSRWLPTVIVLLTHRLDLVYPARPPKAVLTIIFTYGLVKMPAKMTPLFASSRWSRSTDKGEVVGFTVGNQREFFVQFPGHVSWSCYCTIYLCGLFLCGFAISPQNVRKDTANKPKIKPIVWYKIPFLTTSVMADVRSFFQKGIVSGLTLKTVFLSVKTISMVMLTNQACATSVSQLALCPGCWILSSTGGLTRRNGPHFERKKLQKKRTETSEAKFRREYHRHWLLCSVTPGPF